MKSPNIILAGSAFLFIASAILSLTIINLTSTIDSLLQFLALAIVLIIFTTRVILPRFQNITHEAAYFIEFAPLSLFVYLLVFSTGGLASPFLILTHLFAIGMAFLITPKVSVAYVLITVAFIIFNAGTDQSAQALVSESPFAVTLYILAYLAVLPFSQYIAKIYQEQGQWAQKLSQMLTTSKKQEASLLRNITDAALVVSPAFIISFANDPACEKTGFSKRELLGKKVSEILKFKDNLGKNLTFDKLPFASIVKTKSEFSLNELQIAKKDNTWWRVNLKASPLIDHEGTVIGLLLVIKDFSQKDLTLGSYYDKIAQKFTQENQTKISAIARDLLLLLSLESGIEGLTQFLNFSQIVEAEIYNLRNSSFRGDVNIKPSGAKEETLAPRGKIISPQKHGFWQEVFILGNQNLLKVAVSYILKIALSLSPKGDSLTLDVSPSADIVKLELVIASQMPQDKLDLLFQKFFNEFLNVGELADFTGLEIAIAKEIFEKHGGDLKIRQTEEGLLFSATLIRHEAPSEKIYTGGKTSV